MNTTAPIVRDLVLLGGGHSHVIVIRQWAMDPGSAPDYRRLWDALGGADEGAPGPRGRSGFYAGYFRDPDGNKLAVAAFKGG